jgi:hypothetical protein
MAYRKTYLGESVRIGSRFCSTSKTDSDQDERLEAAPRPFRESLLGPPVRVGSKLFSTRRMDDNQKAEAEEDPKLQEELDGLTNGG